MRFFVIIFVLMLFSCSTNKVLESPLGFSFMPGYMDIDSIQFLELDDSSRVVDSSYSDFRSIPIEGGVLTTIEGDTLELPAGILISEKKAAMYTFYKAGYERQQKELRYTKFLLKEYYNRSRAVEGMYQREIMRLEKERERSWFEQNVGYIGYISGALSVILLFYFIDLGDR